jgi:hypothetical protein
MVTLEPIRQGCIPFSFASLSSPAVSCLLSVNPIPNMHGARPQNKAWSDMEAHDGLRLSNLLLIVLRDSSECSCVQFRLLAPYVSVSFTLR